MRETQRPSYKSRLFVSVFVLLSGINQISLGQGIGSERTPDTALRLFSPNWKGFRPTLFETLEPKFFSLVIESRALINRENSASIPIMNADNRLIEYSSLILSSAGWKPPYKESAWIGARLKSRPNDYIGFSTSILGGWGFEHSKVRYHLGEAYGEARLRSLVLAVGRRPMYWGQSFHAPLMISDEAKPLDSITLTTIPVKVGGWFSFLGEIKAEIFFSRMNINRVPHHDYFLGWRVGTKPIRWFELNASALYEFGGSGIDKGSFLDGMIEFFGGRGNKGPGQLDSSNVTNRSFGVDGRISMDTLGLPLSIYSEQHIEDCCGNFVRFMKKSWSYLYGFTLTGDLGELGFEYAKTSDSLYFHTVWKSSASNDNRLMGTPLGADAQGIRLRTILPLIGKRASFRHDFFWEERQRNHRLSDSDFSAYHSGFQESEKRMGFLPSLSWQWNDSWTAFFEAGLVKVWNKQNNRHRDVIDWGTSAGLKVHL